jgi:hypothetical protein
MFAIAVFCFVSVLSINLMNHGLTSASATLELTMARNEIDAQAEAIRFIANSYFAERSLQTSNQRYRILWQAIADIAYYNEEGTHRLSTFTLDNCADAYNWANDQSLFRDSAFILNTRDLFAPYYNYAASESTYQNQEAIEGATKMIIFTRYRNTDFTEEMKSKESENRSDKFHPAALYPRIIYTRTGADTSNNSDAGGSLIETEGHDRVDYTAVARAEGIWIVATTKENKNSFNQDRIEYYDFHIRTCWNAPGKSTPTTIGTIIRVYNPDVIDRQESINYD